MNPTKTTATRLLPVFLAGAFFWSSWLQTARLALITRTPSQAAVQMKQAAVTPRQRFEFSQKLNQAAKDSKALKAEDVREMKKTFGADSEKMLTLLQQAAQ